MRVETAVVNMVEAARQINIAPERLAKAFDLALEKVASLSPVGATAIKIIQTNLIKDLLKQELNVVARIAKGPRALRGSKKALEAGPIKEKTFEDEIEEAFSRGPKEQKENTVTKKPRKQKTMSVTTS